MSTDVGQEVESGFPATIDQPLRAGGPGSSEGRKGTIKASQVQVGTSELKLLFSLAAWARCS